MENDEGKGPPPSTVMEERASQSLSNNNHNNTNSSDKSALCLELPTMSNSHNAVGQILLASFYR